MSSSAQMFRGPRRRRIVLWLALCLPMTALPPGCTRALPEAAFYDATALRDERYQASATQPGPVWLRRAIEVRVGTARSPENARASLRFHGARLRFDGIDEARAQVILTTPPGAKLLNVRARILDGERGERPATPAQVTSAPSVGTADPDDLRWTLIFADIAGSAILEYTADFEVPGTLVTDARWLGTPDGFTREVLVRYDVPDNAVGALHVSDPRLHALARKDGGHTILAVLARHLGAAGPERPAQPSVRYVTKRAAPSGFDQSFAATWAQVAAPYIAALIDRSVALREDHAPPFSPGATGEIGAREAYTWVRDRLQPEDALDADWRAAQALPTALRTNTLNGTDKIHVLHWILDAAAIPHRLAVARSTARPALNPELPAPGVFDRALIYLPDADLWLDPACQTCAPGTVRPTLAGGQALLLPADDEVPRALPSAPAAESLAPPRPFQ
ncbi:MAG: hypothetical protein R3F39_19050 [Myxococcota bacterium]